MVLGGSVVHDTVTLLYVVGKRACESEVCLFVFREGRVDLFFLCGVVTSRVHCKNCV